MARKNSLVSLHDVYDARPGYWNHWIPMARHDNRGWSMLRECGWLLRTGSSKA
jgi:hypothetical protein